MLALYQVEQLRDKSRQLHAVKCLVWLTYPVYSWWRSVIFTWLWPFTKGKDDLINSEKFTGWNYFPIQWII